MFILNSTLKFVFPLSALIFPSHLISPACFEQTSRLCFSDCSVGRELVTCVNILTVEGLLINLCQSVLELYSRFRLFHRKGVLEEKLI